MFYVIVEKFIESKLKMKVWDYLEIDSCYWSKLKRIDKLKLEYYKKLCDACGVSICDDKKELSKKMVELFYAT